MNSNLGFFKKIHFKKTRDEKNVERLVKKE
jgi:hypothetical protein